MDNKNRPRRGAKRKYSRRMPISHSIDLDVLRQVDNLADYDKSRTDIINEAITQYLERGGK